MGGGTGLSNIASSMYAAASMNNAASATVTAQASPEIHNAAAEPTLLEKAHNILDILGCFSDIPDGINALLYLYEGNRKEAVLCAISFLPFGDAVSKGRKAALNAIPEIAEFAGKHADDATELALKKSGKAKGWKVGESIDNLTKAGNEPAWSTVKSRYWKNEAYYNAELYTEADLVRMRKGNAPLHPEIGVPMELHHINGRNIVNPHNQQNLIQVWPWEHADIDSYRYYTGPRPGGN